MSGEQHKIVGIGVGIACSYYAMNNGCTSDAIMIAVASAVGCWLPDMDHDRTKLGRKRAAVTNTVGNIVNFGLYAGIVCCIVLAFLMVFGLVSSSFKLETLGLAIGTFIVIIVIKNAISNSNTYKWVTKHRGLMHTLIPLIPLYCLTFVSASGIWYFSVIGLMVGYMSHLLSDCTTTDGCPLFFPLSREPFRIPIFNTEKKQAAGCWILSIGSIICSYALCNVL